MPDLVDIYTAVANAEVPVDGTTVTAWTLDEVKNSIVSDHLPVRIMLPPGADGGSAIADVDIVTFAQTSVTWRVTELMLYRPVQGRGGQLKNIWERLTQYIADYVATMMSLSTRPVTSRATIISVDPRALILEWPRDSGNEFHGVQATLLVQETIC